MLGGDDDDLEALLEDCGDQVDRPRVRVGAERLNQITVQPQAQGLGMLVESINSLVKQNNELMRREERQNDSRIEETRGKRKEREETNYQPQEPILLLEESYRLEDDGHTVVDTLLRQKLRPINADPKDYWVKGAFRQVERPILGSSLYLEHLISCNVNEMTICKTHDCSAFWEIKNFLTKKSGVGGEKSKLVKGT